MSLQVFEGTWEELKSHDAELIGRQLRVTVIAEPSDTGPEHAIDQSSDSDSAKPKVLRARGMLAGLLTTEAYLREKREDTLREDRSLL